MAGWWLPQLNAKGLSQGDVIRPLISGSAVAPQKSLRRQQLKGNKPGWAEVEWTPDNNGVGHYLASGKILPCLIVSHSCDLEKKKDNSRVLISPMLPLSIFPEEARQFVLQLLTINLFPVVEVPGLEDHCADLRCISYVDRNLVNACEIVVSMSEEGMRNLQAHLVTFFTRIKVPKDEFDSIG